MWFLIILLLLVVIIIYLLLAPFFIEVDSEKGLLRFRFHRLASTRILLENNALVIEIQITGWKRRIDLRPQMERKAKPAAQKRKRKRPEISWTKVKAILQSFKVNTCYVNLDLGDTEWNAFFIPVFFGLSRVSGKSFYINFIEKNEIKLKIENTMAHIFWAYFFK